jgi:hypothetical protein
MARKLVKFTQGYSRYNKGDTAAFEADVAKSLCEGKNKVAKLIGDAAEPVDVLVSSQIGDGASQARAMLDGFKSELQAGAEDLSKREAALVSREADLDNREADLEAREAALVTTTKADKTTKKTTSKKADGAPPKQGAKT